MLRDVTLYVVLGGAVLCVVLIGLLAGVLVPAMFRRRLRRLAPQGRTECGVRVVDAADYGLPSAWIHGMAQVGPHGQLAFWSYRGNVRTLPARP